MQKIKQYFHALLPILIGLSTLHFGLHWVSQESFGELDSSDKILWVVYLLIPILLYGVYKVEALDSNQERNSMYTFFFNGLKIAILILLIVGLVGVYAVFVSDQEGSVFQAVALGIVVIWSCIFLGYFVWAIYFYNINYGITEEDWDLIYRAKSNKRAGDFYSQADLDEEPKYNPYKEETFGLPGGTVRGMIAFTLLFGALAMLVASIGMKNELDPASMFWDQYEFFKTAFLMMIAFYFGSRSLQYLNRNNTPKLSEVQHQTPASISTIAPSQPTVPNIQTIIEDQPKSTPAVVQTVSSEIVDPMQAKS